MSQALVLATLILEILSRFAFPLAVKIIHTLTADEDITIEKLLALKKKLPDIEELEREMGLYEK